MKWCPLDDGGAGHADRRILAGGERAYYGVNGRAESLGFLPRKISPLSPDPKSVYGPRVAAATIHDRPKGQSTATQLLLLLRIQRGEGQRSEMKCMMGCKNIPIL